jgi:hypothetical protein
LNWVQEKPDIEDGERIIVVVDDRSPLKSRRKDIRRVLEEARGAWGTGKSLAQIDQEIDARRAADWPDDRTARP